MIITKIHIPLWFEYLSMQKCLFIWSLFFVLFFSCKEKNEYVIISKLQNFSDSIVFVTQDGSKEIDTIFCKKGQFEIKGVSDSLIYLSVYLPGTAIWVDVWVEGKDHLSVTGDTKYPDLIEVRGNPAVDKLSGFKTANRSLLKEKTDLYYQQINSAADSLEGNSNEVSYSARISNVEHQLKEKAEEFVKENPNQPASLILLRDYLIDHDNIAKMDSYLSSIRLPASGTSVYKQLEGLYQKIKQTSIGAKAPDFNIVDVENDTVLLSDFNGEYLLLTFAASWCDVCRKDNKELVEAYHKYHPKGLEMFTVSFDEKKMDWQKAAKEDKITWRQAIDTHGWGAEMLDLYNITSIPSNLLIDKDGVIIAKNLFGEELMHKLSEIYQ